MSIRQLGTFHVSRTDIFNLALLGDGESNEVVIDMAEAPHNVDFHGNFPVELTRIGGSVVVEGKVDDSFTFKATMKHSLITITYNKPLPIGDFSLNTGASVNGVYVYEGK